MGAPLRVQKLCAWIMQINAHESLNEILETAADVASSLHAARSTKHLNHTRKLHVSIRNGIFCTWPEPSGTLANGRDPIHPNEVSRSKREGTQTVTVNLCNHRNGSTGPLLSIYGNLFKKSARGHLLYLTKTLSPKCFCKLFKETNKLMTHKQKGCV